VQVRSGNPLEYCYLTEDTCKEEVITKVAFFLLSFSKNTCGQDKQSPMEYSTLTCTSLILIYCFCINGCSLKGKATQNENLHINQLNHVMKFCQSILVTYPLDKLQYQLKTWKSLPMEAVMMRNSLVLKTTKVYKFDVAPSHSGCMRTSCMKCIKIGPLNLK
jgi:hypothetical protein